MKKIIIILVLVMGWCNFIKAEEVKTSTGVVIEEYVPEVIIEGKWGTGPGEFGNQVDENFPGTGRVYKPKSLAADSKGNIYILDVTNNQIQKFDKNGKYLKSIPVESFIGEHWGWEVIYNSDGSHAIIEGKEKPEGDFKIFQKLITPKKIQGVNIVIDSQDNMHYYCIRKNNGKETGEVWRFKDDKLAERRETEKKGRFEVEEDYIIQKHKVTNNIGKIIIKFRDGRKIEKKIESHRNLDENEKFAVGNPFVIDNGKKILISRSIGKYEKNLPYAKEIETYMDIYNSKGNLISTIKGNSSGEFDGYGNRYSMAVDSKGIIVTKFERKLIK
ncbi:hypothetical protein KKF70_03040 [bacterium]|nr:hypothetical protein [bacterium]